MNTLIITAHPASYGFTHTIAKTYAQTKESQEDSVDVIDLYKETRQRGFIEFENLSDLVLTEDQTYYQEKISWADEIVFVYPTWWMYMPAIAKNWLEWNLTTGFAFNFSAEGKPTGLLKGKTARVFVTADGPKFIYAIFKPMYAMIIGKGVLGFCGIKLASFDIFPEMIKNKNDTARNRMLETVRKRANK